MAWEKRNGSRVTQPIRWSRIRAFQSIDGTESDLGARFGMKELFKRGGDLPPISRKTSSAGTLCHRVISGSAASAVPSAAFSVSRVFLFVCVKRSHQWFPAWNTIYYYYCGFVEHFTENTANIVTERKIHGCVNIGIAVKLL